VSAKPGHAHLSPDHLPPAPHPPTSDDVAEEYQVVSFRGSAPAPVHEGPSSVQTERTLDTLYGVDLFWLPLGAGGWFVRLNGRVYEACDAAIHRRSRYDLYHSALEVHVPSGRFVIEQTPIADARSDQRGVVAEGAVGSRWAGRLRIFRYEVRRWRDGVIPDLSEAVDSPRHLTDDPAVSERLLDLVPSVPTAVWGRDELHAGEMWNSNSIIAWLIVSAGLDAAEVQFPTRGRAPGWQAGIVVASRAEQLGKAAPGMLRGRHG
jgi:hypothetical protein